MSIISAVEQSFQQHLLPNHHTTAVTTIYVACSGGRDSMALLSACHALQLPIHVLHINHQLQYPSNDWQYLVESFCNSYHIPCTSVKINWQTQGVLATNVNEQHARHARYQAIVGMVPEDAIIALAHHADDQAETLLLNLCQGTGVTGLSGMQPWRVQQEFGKRIWLWRPLLSVSRQQITAFVHQKGIKYVDDPTNVGGANRRAWLRQSVMPLLKSQFPALLDNISRTATNLAEAKQIIDEQAHFHLLHCQLDSGWTATQQRLNINELKRLSSANATALLRVWITGNEKFAPNRQFVAQVYQLVLQDNTEQKTLLQWQGIVIRRYQQVLYRLDKTYQQITHRMMDKDKVLSDIQVQLLQSHCLPRATVANLELRHVLPNEKFQRLTSLHHEPFKKLCQRHHIPSWERGLAWVLVNKKKPEIAIALLLPGKSFWLLGAKHMAISSHHDGPRLSTNLL